MNSIDYYQAEINYRREQMLRDRAPMRRFRRALRIATASAPRNHTR